MIIIKAGDKYNRLTAIKFSHKKGTGQYWLFRCDCGNEKVIYVNDVKSGHTKSCGCLRKGLRRNFKHGMKGTKIYGIWTSMKNRCLNKNNKHYKDYGSRGITVCSEWQGKKGFENFYKDMGDRPEEKSIDRINNNKGYYKENCRWATWKQQANNRRNIKRLNEIK